MKNPKLPIAKKKLDPVGLVAKKKLPPTGLSSAKRLAMKSLSSIAWKSVADILEAPCGIAVEKPRQGGPCGIIVEKPRQGGPSGDKIVGKLKK